LGIVILVNLVQPLNASLEILSPPVIITVLSVNGIQEFGPPNIKPKWVLEVPFKVAPTNGIVILTKLVQPRNASLPMLVTLSGMIILVKLVHIPNA
jgi:hypothetical protein